MPLRRLFVVFIVFASALAGLTLAPASCSSGGVIMEEPAEPDGGVPPDGATSPDGMVNPDGGQPTAGPWQPVAGIYGGCVGAIAIATKNPANMYAGTCGSGVFRSLDGGATWNPAARGLENVWVTVISIDPKLESTLFAIGSEKRGCCGGDRKVFRSLDSGASWKELTFPVPMGWDVYYAVEPHPKTAGLVYVLAGDGVYRSSNNGDSFGAVKSGLPSSGLWRSMAVDPTDDQIAYVLAGVKVFKTRDGGVNWVDRSSGLPTAATGRLESIILDPRSPQNLYLAGFGVPGFWKSTDGGLSWRAGGSPRLNYGGSKVIIDAMGQIYTFNFPFEIYKSTDDGASFRSFTTGFSQGTSAMAVHPTDVKQIYIGWVFNGLTKTSDGGMNYVHADTGILNRSVRALAFAPSDPNVVYAGLDFGGVVKSIDGGRNFAPNTGPMNLPETLACTALAVHPTDPNIVYAGTVPGSEWSSLSSYPKERVYKSIDGGATFYKLDLGLDGENRDIRQLLIDPADPKNILVFGDLTFRSTNEGVSFTKLNPPLYIDYAIADPADGKRVTVHAGNYWARTDDRGTTWNSWKTSMNGMSGRPFLEEMPRFVIDPQTPATYYGCHADGLYKSENAGTTWSHASVGFMNDEACGQLAISAVQPKLLFTFSGTMELYRTSDGATTWQRSTSGLPPIPELGAIALSPKNPDIALIATVHASGIYRTQSGGR